MSFHEEQFPPSISLGSSGGPERRTEIVQLANGFEERNTNWANSRRRYDAGLGMKSLADLQKVIAFFEARHGQLYGFRWKDWADFSTALGDATVAPEDEVIGTGDGNQKIFALTKTYQDSSGSYSRPIQKPRVVSVRVAIDGTEIFAGQDFVVDGITGEMTLTTAPGVNAEITAGFEFDVPVRFDTDFLNVTISGFEAGEIPSIPVVEIRV